MKMSVVSNAAHTLSYSIIALQEMNLAYQFPIVYWNTANLIVDSGGVQYENDDEETINIELLDETSEEQDEDEDLEDWEIANSVTATEKDKKKKKEKNIDYGRVASIIGRMKNEGILVSPPNINESSFTFTPIAKENIILYGMRGIARISGEKINEIIAGRPYISMKDFLSRNNLNKIQMTNLIKSGAFDSLYNCDREQIMQEYLESIADKKQRLTLQNMQMLITKGLIPDEMSFYAKLFQFNKFLKGCKNGLYYELNDAAIRFIDNNFEIDTTSDGNQILQKTWDNMYKKAMEPMRKYLKDNNEEMLTKLNNSLYQEIADKYACGNISKWEMDSISFYYHPHELEEFKNGFDDFFTMPEEPIVENSFMTKQGQEIKIMKLYSIIGTVIDKDKNRNTITLLTPTGVVNVRIYKNQFAIYDKQISMRDEDGKKHVIETSWFKRGTLLRLQGFRRGNDFVPRKNKRSIYPIIMKITSTENGALEYQEERMEVDS